MQNLFSILLILTACLPFVVLLRWISRSSINKTLSIGRMFKLLSLGLAMPLPAAILEIFSVPATLYLPVALQVPAKAFLAVGLVEEFAKLTAVYAVARQRSAFAGGAVDGAAYGILVGLGFAAAENLLYITGADSGFGLALTRGVTAIPLHTLTTGIAGLAWGRYVTGRDANRPSSKAVLCGLLAATLIHGFYNWPLTDNSLPYIASLVVMITGWLIFIPILSIHAKTSP